MYQGNNRNHNKDVHHERCYCSRKRISQCQEECDVDIQCKGFVENGLGHCELATTSDCPIGCVKKDVNSVGALTDSGLCDYIGEYIGRSSYDGCYIKLGW